MIWLEIAAERASQILKFPEEERGLPDGTGGGGRETYRAIAQNACDRAQREGRLTHAHIFEEETAEVLADTDPVKLRKELVQVAAVCVKWIEDLDRRAKCGRCRGLGRTLEDAAADLVCRDCGGRGGAAKP